MPDADLPAPVAERLAALAEDQRMAATAPAGPVLCIAPAGSGKTTTVVARIAWRIARGADPATICALTFNRMAADELRERLGRALGPLGVAPDAVRVRTFHALGREILADAGVAVDRLVDRATVLGELAGGPLAPAALRRLEDAFSRFGLDPARAPTDPPTCAAWAAYRAEIDRRGALDLDDLVARAVPTLRAHPALLARWRARTAVLFVDEAQDLDHAQLELALLLAGEARDIFLVGDDDQTIYAWRLADVRRILGLAGALPGLLRVDLVTNHRCPPEVVRRAARLIAHGRERFAKRILPSERTAGTLLLAPDPGDPHDRAYRLLERWLPAAEGRHAVLARTNAELAPVAAAALERGIPWAGPDGLLALTDPARADVLAGTTAPDPEALVAAGRGPEPAASAARTLAAWSAGGVGPRELEGRVEDARARAALLCRPDADLVLATVHGTKGLEFDHVAVLGMDAGTFPSGRSITDAPEPARAREEERRLAYVAWTRARRSLLLVHDPAAPSAFLREAFDADELARAWRAAG
ncbi:MAG: UvrD-helicase domain-containing protein [Chloroflexota bacterium]